MSHFYGSMQGNRGPATRGGSKASGLDAHIRGWHIGVQIMLRHNKDTNKDEIAVYKTGGSSDASKEELIATF